MQFYPTSALNQKEKNAIFSLWNKEYPEALRHKTMESLEQYLKALTDPRHLLILDEKDQFAGWYFDFLRDQERWFAVIIDQHFQGQGLGREIMSLAKQQNHILNGWVIDGDHHQKSNGESYRSPLAFYQKHGFKILGEQRLELENFSAVKIQWTKVT